MRVVVEMSGYPGSEAEVRVNRPDATVGDLASALDPNLPPSTLW